MCSALLINEGCDVCFFKFKKFSIWCSKEKFSALQPLASKGRAYQGNSAPTLVARYLGTALGTGASAVSVRVLFLYMCYLMRLLIAKIG